MKGPMEEANEERPWLKRQEETECLCIENCDCGNADPLAEPVIDTDTGREVDMMRDSPEIDTEIGVGEPDKAVADGDPLDLDGLLGAEPDLDVDIV